MDKKMIVIGLVGPIKAGKGELAKYLVESHGVVVYRFSQILGWILDILCLSQSRENFQDLAIALRKKFGSGVLVLTLKNDIIAESPPIALVDGVRVWEEAEMIKELGGFLIYVTASDEVRFKRLQSAEKAGEELQTFEDFLQSQKKKTELLIAEIGQSADYQIINESSIEELYAQIEGIISELHKGGS